MQIETLFLKSTKIWWEIFIYSYFIGFIKATLYNSNISLYLLYIEFKTIINLYPI
jgi:hypothetical protein